MAEDLTQNLSASSHPQRNSGAIHDTQELPANSFSAKTPSPAYLGETLAPDADPPPISAGQAATLDALSYTTGTPGVFRRQFADYELLEEVARGGMGVVFKARQKSLHRIVALKMILAGHLASAEQVRRFHLEAEEAGLLDHPNIVPIYQVGQEDGQHYFTMKLIDGGSLAQRLKATPMPPRDAVRLVATVARAVHYAHQRGILHRDLKPGNILLDAKGEPHVTDFGLAKHLAGPGGPNPENAPTLSGAIIGTPAYMAPEQAAARRDLSVAVDVYSLGAVLFELLTGRPPFQAGTAYDTLLQVMEMDPPRPRSLNPHLDRDLETITLKCLEKEPQHRYGSALRLAEDLDRYLAGEPILARPASRIERTVKWARRRPAIAALVGVICLAGVLFLAFGWWTNLQLKNALKQTQDEREEAQRQRLDAMVQRDRVQANLQKRLDIIDDFLVRMDDRLQRQGVPQSVRLEFLNDALDLSKGVLKENPESPSARRQLASLQFRMADLFRRGRLFPEANVAIASALKIQKELVEADPENLDYQQDLAVTNARNARLLQDQHRLDEALKAEDEALRLEDALVRANPQELRYPSTLAFYRYRRADILDEAGRRKAAEQEYREALKQMEALAAKNPHSATYHRQVGTFAGGLASLLAIADPQAAIPYRKRVVEAMRQVARLSWIQKPYSGDLLESYYDLISLLRLCNKHRELLQLADTLRHDAPDDSGASYDAACIAANAIVAAQQDKTLTAEQRTRLAEEYANQAMKLLTMAVHEGYREHTHMARDTDLDPLRQRKDYQELVSGLEQRFPVPRPTPAQELTALQQEYEGAKDNYETLQRRVQSIADKRKAETRKPKFEEFAERAIRFAKLNRDSSSAVDALVWILETSAPEDGQQISESVLALRDRALKLLEQDHFQKPELAGVCQRLSESPAPDCQKFLRDAVEKHAHPDVRGLAGYALALSLARQAEAAQEVGSAEAGDLFRSAGNLLEQVIQKYPDVPCGQSKLGDSAKSKLHALRHLAIGRPALEIEGKDLEGKPMKRSELQGKVVVIFFWADWCGYCRQMYAQNRLLVERYKDQPFTLVGVNCDDDKKNAERAIQKSRLNWRNWWDGDRAGNARITSTWQIGHFPSIFVLDKRGIIRYKDVRGDKLEAAVAELLKE
jgi:peroxiredoxin/tRNA A-37 threonylcarbamoyl transferase component Bud32